VLPFMPAAFMLVHAYVLARLAGTAQVSSPNGYVHVLIHSFSQRAGRLSVM
jgi:hypothetical protein